MSKKKITKKRVLSPDRSTAAHITQCLYLPLRRYMVALDKDGAYSRLQSHIFKALSTDKINPPGRLDIANARLTGLKGFEFNGSIPITQPFYKRCRSGLIPEDNAVHIWIPTIRPSRHIIAPPEATHFRIISGLLVTSLEEDDYIYSEHKWSGYYSVNEKVAASLRAISKVLEGKLICAVVLGIVFYEIRNNELFALENTRSNSLIIHSIECG